MDYMKRSLTHEHTDIQLNVFMSLYTHVYTVNTVHVCTVLWYMYHVHDNEIYMYTVQVLLVSWISSSVSKEEQSS